MAEHIEREAFISRYRELYCEDCDKRKGVKNGKIRFCYAIGDAPCRACSIDDMLTAIDDFPAADVLTRTEAAQIIKDAARKVYADAQGSFWQERYARGMMDAAKLLESEQNV